MLKIREYYAFIFAGVDLIYQNVMANDFRLRIKLAKLVILKDSTTIPLVYSKRYTNVVDGVQIVLNFRSFLRNNLGFSYDHATLFLRSGFVKDNTTEFLSTVMGFTNSLCDTYGSSSSLVYDIQNYQVTLYVAQAIAYSLSANNDGDGNNCSSQDNYLMGSTDENITESAKLNAWKFSNCTLKYFVDFIHVLKNKTYGQQCLTKTLPVSEEVPDVSQRLLGQEVSPDEQCRLSTRNSNFRQQFSNGTFPNICTELVCVNSQNKSEVFVISALSGTSCGCGKVCTQGQCVSEPLFVNIDCNVKDDWANCTLTLCLDNGVGKFCQDTCANYLMYSSITTTVKTSTSTTTVKTSTAPSSTSPTPYTMAAITSTAATTSKNSTGTLCQDSTFFTYNDLNCYNAMLTAQNLCYEASVQTSCCASCAQRSVNIPGCKYGDRDKSLCSSIPSCKGQETNCCQTCRVNTAGRLLPGGIFLLTFNIAACILVFLISLT